MIYIHIIYNYCHLLCFQYFFYYTVLRTVQKSQSGSSGDIGATQSEILGYKGKAIPLQAWKGPGDSRRMRHMKVVRLSALRTGSLYPPENIPGTHFC